jgi:hypothetical protein
VRALTNLPSRRAASVGDYHPHNYHPHNADCNGVPGGPASLDACLVCGGDGTSCADPVCQNLRAPRHGGVHYTHVDDRSGAVRFPATATYECEDGYAPSETAPRQCQWDQASGTAWSGHDATCDAVACEALPALSNGEVYYSHHRAYKSRCRYPAAAVHPPHPQHSKNTAASGQVSLYLM